MTEDQALYEALDVAAEAELAGPPETAGEEPGWVEIEGYRVDPVTGECLGPIDGPEPKWRPTDLQGAIWVLRRRRRAALRLRDLKEAMAREIAEETERIRNEFDASLLRAEQRLGWWAQYEEDLMGITIGELEGSKAKSIEAGGCRMGFRRTPGRIDVLDERLALAWARTHLPEAIVVKESIAKKTLKGYEPSELPDDAFTVVPPEDRFYIEEAAK